ncbi:MAG: UDP-N-acetylmuramoyl-L-alanine--D-glutamate ligase [Puniceicoccales bacterium]|jgi:UDP-N-acetylmuramoylalanine--D-glutamate ligase|nr:UDP-N-acetylmuramoyl-L-alanine--D-glutamate ligase [Puniceicoccales bacterium]
MVEICTLKKELFEKILLKKNKPIAILGNGVSAHGLRKLFAKLDLRHIIYDQNPEKGENFTKDNVKNHEIIICSPSFLPHHPWIISARQNGLLCLSELDFASLWCDAPVVAITGTNGKTTITTFLTKLFNRCGVRAFCGGNLDRSLSELVATETLKSDDLVFCETSSFQAESSQLVRFTHLIWSNFAPNHLNVHKTIRRYFLAKYHLLACLREDAQIFCGQSICQWAHKFQVVIPEKVQVVTSKCDAKGTAFSDYPQRENFALIKKFCSMHNISSETVLMEAKNFQKPKYRLENMGIIQGNAYWNDSKCTNFAALDGALKNFPREKVIWIGGGQSKGEDLKNIIPLLKGKVEIALLIGETGIILADLLQKHKINAVYVESIENAINEIKKTCFLGKNIVFSPAFSSFDQFLNYIERGKFFEKCIFDLKFLHH